MNDKKREGPMNLDMGFDEALQRFAQTDPNELHENLGAAPSKSLARKEKMSISPEPPAPPTQLKLDLGIEVEKSVGGIEMGVLENGLPYLTQRGLAAMSGAARATIFEISQEWREGYGRPIDPKTRLGFFQNYLFENGYDEPELFVEIIVNGSPHYAYPEIVCMAVIEYYAFEAQRTNDDALQNYRRLARFGLQKFIYDALGREGLSSSDIFKAIFHHLF